MRTILVVDDDAQVRWSLAENLSDFGYRVHRDCNGRDALDSLRRLAEKAALPDLVVTDFSMPEMTGYELIQACQADPVLAKIPFILCSSDMDSGRLADKLGVPFYSKFDRFKCLIDKIANILKET